MALATRRSRTISKMAADQGVVSSGGLHELLAAMLLRLVAVAPGKRCLVERPRGETTAHP